MELEKRLSDKLSSIMRMLCVSIVCCALLCGASREVNNKQDVFLNVYKYVYIQYISL